jgi:hypothetical protein
MVSTWPVQYRSESETSRTRLVSSSVNLPAVSFASIISASVTLRAWPVSRSSTGRFSAAPDGLGIVG